MGACGRVFQLATDTVTAGDLDGSAGFPGFFDDGLQDCDLGYGSVFALGRTPGCWHCGGEHLHRDCPFPASQAEKDGLPMNQWAKQPGLRPTGKAQVMGAAPQRPSTRTMGTVATSSPPILAQAAGMSMRIDRQEAMLEAILERLTPGTTSTPAASALLAPAVFTSNTNLTAGAPTTLAQIAGPAPVAMEPVPLIMGGPPPVCYVYVCSNQGMSIWGHAEIVAASVVDSGEPGNGGGL
jgi:hypothetical protein